MTTSRFSQAIIFAATAHREQVRKYTGIPYVLHTIEVMEIVRSVVSDDENLLISGLLHDVVEDTDATVEYVRLQFGDDVAGLVEELTDVYTSEAYPDMNRAARKEHERERLSEVSDRAQTAKLADMISNTKDIVANDKAFAKVYLKEKHLLLPALSRGNPHLLARAETAVRDGCIALGIKTKDL